MYINNEIDSEKLDTSDNRRIETINRNKSLNSFGNYGMNRRIRIVGR